MQSAAGIREQDPGDGTAIVTGPTFEREYARPGVYPGVYQVTLRIVSGERLREYQIEVAVARDVLLQLPLVAVPELIKDAQSIQGKRSIRARATFSGEATATAGNPVGTATAWTVIAVPSARRAPPAGVASDPNEAVLDLPTDLVAGKRPLRLAYRAVRSQDVLFYSRQRYKREPTQMLRLETTSLATNRRYEGQPGSAPPANGISKHLFGDPPNAVFGPVDTWSFELPRPENGQQQPGPFSGPESKQGSLLFDGSQVDDLILTLEYEVGPASNRPGVPQAVATGRARALEAAPAKTLNGVAPDTAPMLTKMAKTLAGLGTALRRDQSR